jgi:CMP-N-acetylneuraminic acid synthetase
LTILSSQVLGLICARLGSKGIPRKNLCALHGKPLVAWIIQAALGAPSLHRVVMSTEASEIADAARQYGAEVPFLRPGALALDTTPGVAPVLHAITWFEENEGYRPEYVMLLQPTSPLTSAGDIESAVEMAVTTGADSLVSICEASQHPYWTYRLRQDGTIAGFAGSDCREMEKKYPRRQDLPPAYVENGAIHLARRSALLREESFYSPAMRGYLMPLERSLDIDTPLDLRLAEWFLSQEGAP